MEMAKKTASDRELFSVVQFPVTARAPRPVKSTRASANSETMEFTTRLAPIRPPIAADFHLLSRGGPIKNSDQVDVEHGRGCSPKIPAILKTLLSLFRPPKPLLSVSQSPFHLP